MSNTNGTTLFSGEVQLASWKETHNGGATVTIWLADPEQLESFRKMTERKGKIAGQRLGMVLVEINDDETLVEQPPTKPAKEKLGPLALLAVQWCEDPVFQLWLANKFDHLGGMTGTINTATTLKTVLGIRSRKDLDVYEQHANKFQNMIRAPYMRHLENKA